MFEEKINKLIRDLPDGESAARFLSQLAEKFPVEEKKLLKNDGLLSDVLTLVAYSPLLATTFLQHKTYFGWLNRQRISSKVRGKEELLESLARFALTNSMLETNVLLTRFRRRELLRIYLHDIRNLETIAEITEEISNLADACLEYALRIARQELDNRYGHPLEIDTKGRSRQAKFCIVALGKLGSKELNYASDIDLLFLYSSEGKTSGNGSRGSVTNREYFVKLSEFIIKLVGQQTGEGAAYRVDMRLRPHGRVGALAIAADEALHYYQKTSQSWERQVLIRSRASAGEAAIFRDFFEKVVLSIFSTDETVENALRNVRLSKEKIDLEKVSATGFDVKLGKGGIREIEFIAQALQIAYGGRDEWLRVSHTLISLSRLADRRLISEADLTELSDAYKFLRRLEHRLQMENGLQTHLVPNEETKRLLVAKRVFCDDLQSFDEMLNLHTSNVNRIFKHVFSAQAESDFVPSEPDQKFSNSIRNPGNLPDSQNLEFRISNFKAENPAVSNKTDRQTVLQSILSSLEKSDLTIILTDHQFSTLKTLAEISPHFAEMIAANPILLNELPDPNKDFVEPDYRRILLSEVEKEPDFAQRLAILRKNWSRFLLEIAVCDVYGKLSRLETKRLQTRLAEASLETAIFITRKELGRRFEIKIDEFPFAVLGLGKLGGKGMDYGSDLDLVLVYDDFKDESGTGARDVFGLNGKISDSPSRLLSPTVFYARAVEIFVTALSAMTREGSLYRVDLRLRPDGKNGAVSTSKTAFLNYLQNRAAIWEWLAYVKIRGVSGDLNLADEVAQAARKIIHQNALRVDKNELRIETLRVRQNLQTQKSDRRTGKNIDIKFGEGGMLDVYFAMRFLQLRDNVPDDIKNRSTDFMLKKLFENQSLSEENYRNFSDGYQFLSNLDHQLRLTVGRSTRLPSANKTALQIIAERMKFETVANLLENLTFHRLNIRYSFENILKS